MGVRTPREIIFRLRQEARNVVSLLRPPSLPDSVQPPAPLRGLPAPALIGERLRGTGFAAEIERLAELILQHRFPLLGLEIETGPEIRWRRDYLHRVESGTEFFRRIPYLDFARAGDHKVVWELNRHQHLVLLAQAFALTSRDEFLAELEAQLESWFRANPYLRGINWTSALEVAIRSLSWVWIYHLAGARLNAALRRLLLGELYRSAWYLESNLSVYFSPNTHLLGEALALFAAGHLFPEFPTAGRWEQKGRQLLEEQIAIQVRADGSYFEQSTYYHLYALDMFLFYAALAEPPPAVRERILAMAGYLEAVLGPCRTLPLIGDDDGGRLFYPYGRRDRFGRAALATCGARFDRPEWIVDPADLCEQAVWWLGERAFTMPRENRNAPPASRLFRCAGTAVLRAGDLHVLIDGGPFGPWSSGHSHSDTLHLVVRRGEEELLIDPGTFTYISSPEWRDRFRGSAAHNTVRVDGINQAAAIGPFSWREQPEVEVLEWVTTPDHDFLDAVCRAREFTHRRRVLLVKPELLLIVDEIAGAAGRHVIEQFWHCGEAVYTVGQDAFRIGGRASLAVTPGGEAVICEGGEFGWRSRAFAEKSAAPVIRVALESALPVRLGAVLDVSGACVKLDWEAAGAEPALRISGGGEPLTVRFPLGGVPEYRYREVRG